MLHVACASRATLDSRAHPNDTGHHQGRRREVGVRVRVRVSQKGWILVSNPQSTCRMGHFSAPRQTKKDDRPHATRHGCIWYRAFPAALARPPLVPSPHDSVVVRPRRWAKMNQDPSWMYPHCPIQQSACLTLCRFCLLSRDRYKSS